MAKSKTTTRSRSAKTGKYVTKEYAKKHPSTTVTEKRKK
jgi:FMN-dependent NADH-azoreductase